MGMGDDIVLTPDQDLPDSVGGSLEYPIYVTVPPTQLEDFLDNLSATYKGRVDDFVFFSGGLQYGNIEDLLKQRGTLVIFMHSIWSYVVFMRTGNVQKKDRPVYYFDWRLEHFLTFEYALFHRILSRDHDPGSDLGIKGHSTESSSRYQYSTGIGLLRVRKVGWGMHRLW